MSKIKNNKNFFLINRAIFQSSVRSDFVLFSIYLYCLSRANFEDSSIIIAGKRIEIPRGSFVTSIANITQDINYKVKKSQQISEKVTRCKIGVLIRANKLESKTSNQYSLISVKNYDFWQGQGNARGIAKGQTKSQATVTRRSTDNNVNNLNNKKLKIKKDNLNKIYSALELQKSIGGWTSFLGWFYEWKKMSEIRNDELLKDTKKLKNRNKLYKNKDLKDILANITNINDYKLDDILDLLDKKTKVSQPVPTSAKSPGERKSLKNRKSELMDKLGIPF